MKKSKISMFTLLTKYTIYIVLLILIILFSLLSKTFLQLANIINILRQVAVIGIGAAGMTFIIISGGIDLSVGSTIGVTAVLAAKLMVLGSHPVLACIIVLLLGIVIGAINGIFVNEIKVPPLIATLGTMTMLRGVAYLITGGMPIFGFPQSFTIIGQGYLSIVPIPVIIMVVVFIIGFIILDKTKFGRYVYGTGSNEEASRLSGVKVRKIKYYVYCLGGFMAALAGIVLLSRVNSGQPNAGTGYELDIITAVVLGGVSINGGEGKITSVIVGVLIMGVLANGMIMVNISEYYQLVVKGAVLLFAVSYDSLMLNKNRKIKTVG